MKFKMQIQIILLLSLSLVFFGCVSSEDLNKANNEKFELIKQKVALQGELNNTKSLCQQKTAELNEKNDLIENLTSELERQNATFADYELAYKLRQINLENLSEEIRLSKEIDAYTEIFYNNNISSSIYSCKKVIDAQVNSLEAINDRSEIYALRNKKTYDLYNTSACKSAINKLMDLSSQLTNLREDKIRILDKDHYCDNYFDPYYSYNTWMNSYYTPLAENSDESNALIEQYNQYYYDALEYCALE